MINTFNNLFITWILTPISLIAFFTAFFVDKLSFFSLATRIKVGVVMQTISNIKISKILYKLVIMNDINDKYRIFV